MGFRLINSIRLKPPLTFHESVYFSVGFLVRTFHLFQDVSRSGWRGPPLPIGHPVDQVLLVRLRYTWDKWLIFYICQACQVVKTHTCRCSVLRRMSLCHRRRCSLSCSESAPCWTFINCIVIRLKDKITRWLTDDLLCLLLPLPRHTPPRPQVVLWVGGGSVVVLRRKSYRPWHETQLASSSYDWFYPSLHQCEPALLDKISHLTVTSYSRHFIKIHCDSESEIRFPSHSQTTSFSSLWEGNNFLRNVLDMSVQ